MPFKTKRQKISAKSRHDFQLTSEKSIKYSGDSKVALEQLTGKKVNVSSRDIVDDYKYVQKELFRIIVLAIIIIGLQLALKFSHLSIFK